jgi:hypothetical protein
MVLDGTLGELQGLGSTGARAVELPEAQVVGPRQKRRPTRKAMLGDRFYVYGSEALLAPPIDWLQDPQESRSWRYELHTLTWLKEALARHAVGGDVEMLAVARDVVVDWARAHRQQAAEQSEFAWYDMAIGLRAPYVAYTLRACLAGQMLDDENAELLLEIAERHGAELADGGNYAAGHNHGLFQDEGLYLLARLLPVLPAAPAWRELALRRIKATLEQTISFADGAHLEHSPAYQLAMVDLLARLAPNVGELPELGPLLDRMRRTAAWQTTPLGRMAQLGDTDDLPAPRWARQAADEVRGLNLLPEAGQAFVREGGSYLAVAAAYHGRAHKHADEGGFVLVEDGRVVLGDSGRWGYYEDEPDRLYARSAAAHNVLTVDERDFEWRAAEPYGSGLEVAGEGDGWYVVVVRNPLLGRQGVLHRRGFFYRPGRALVVIERLQSERQHTYDRHFHFGPELELDLEGGSRITFAGGDMAGALIELTEGSELNLTHGHEQPHLGWTYPGDRQRTEIWTARLRSFGGDATLITAISMDGQPVEEIPGTLQLYL